MSSTALTREVYRGGFSADHGPFTKTPDIRGVKNNQRGTNTNRIVPFRKR